MPVTIYTKEGCPYCSAAKESLMKQGHELITTELAKEGS